MYKTSVYIYSVPPIFFPHLQATLGSIYWTPRILIDLVVPVGVGHVGLE